MDNEEPIFLCSVGFLGNGRVGSVSKFGRII